MTRPNISVTIMPTYNCSNNCAYCYLSKAERLGNTTLRIDRLHYLLEELNRSYTITNAEVYGGEIGDLDIAYLYQINKVIRKYTDRIQVTSNNVGKMHEAFNIPVENINVSINNERCDFKYNRQLLRLYKKLGALTVVTYKVLHRDVKDILDWYDGHEGMVTFFIQQDQVEVPVGSVRNADYEAFMLDLFYEYYKNRSKYKFTITNALMIRKCIEGTYDPLMCHNIFITPYGNFAKVHQSPNKETFSELLLSRFQELCEKEKVDRAICCGTCENFNCCYAEHVRTNDNQRWTRHYGDTCDGMITLVNTFKEHPEWT